MRSSFYIDEYSANFWRTGNTVEDEGYVFLFNDLITFFMTLQRTNSNVPDTSRNKRELFLNDIIYECTILLSCLITAMNNDIVFLTSFETAHLLGGALIWIGG
mgnify:CR=1 FL=1